MARPLYSHRSARRNDPSMSRLAPMAIDAERDVITTILVLNLHCSSCVHTIQDALSALSPSPTSIQVSIVSQSVTVYHPEELPAAVIQSSLVDAGFDVSTSQSPTRTGVVSGGMGEFLAGKREKHIHQCSLCREEELHLDFNSKLGLDRDFNSLEAFRSNAGISSLRVTEEEKVIETDEKSMTSQADDHDAGPFRVALSVGGMTCSSCSGSITKTVSYLQGVSEVAVSLLNKSAIVIVDHKKVVEAVVEAVEDCGFEAEVITITQLNSLNENSSSGLRTVALRIDGMFCRHCPEKVMAAVKSLSPDINIIKSITTYTDPILELAYSPSPPLLTIREIISAIASSKSPPFDVHLYHPPSLEERARSMHALEQRAIFCRLMLTVVIAIPTFIIGIVFMSLVQDGNATKAFWMQPIWTGNTSRSQWALFFLATPVQFYSASMFHRRSIKEIRALWKKGSTTPIIKRFIRFGSMNLLVSSGVSVAYFSSIALLGLAAAQPASTTGVGDTTTYFDSVVLLTGFLLAGRCLEAYSKARTADAITALSLLRPAEALLLNPISETTVTNFSNGEDIEKGDPNLEDAVFAAKPGFRVEKIDASLLEVGDIVRVQCGATPPADGTIVSGEHAAFDESSLTGESKLIRKAHGDKVFMGTINKMQMVDVRVDAHGGATMLDRIVEVVREGQTRRAPIERVADLLTGYFVPVVTLLAITTWVVWFSLGQSGTLPANYLDIPIGGWPVWSLEFAVAVFVVACPCGIGLAAPTALLVGSGLAAKHGILARGGGEAFQEMAQLDVMVFDKTGTLTEGGEPTVSDAEILSVNNSLERKVILGLAANLESASSHPLGTAIRKYCESEGASSVDGSMFEETAGRGLTARFENPRCTAIIGSEAWLEEHGAIVDCAISHRLEGWKAEAKSIIILGIRDETLLQDNSFEIAAVFAVSDRLRSEAKSVVSHLQQDGIGTWMISGDNAKTALAIAQAVGIPATNVIAGVLPHEKAQKIQWLQQVGAKRRQSKWRTIFGQRYLNQRCIVAMVGDGINDAPALTAADIGVAIGSGSDVAVSSASFILLSSNLRSLVTLSDLSRKVFNRVKQNFFYAAVYNCIALPIAAGLIYPAGHVRLSPVWASLAMALSSVSVVCSSLLLKLYKEPKIKKS